MGKVKAPVKTGMEVVVKVHYVERCSEPLRPRVMRRLPVRGRRSVGGGIRRRGIELRNQSFGVSTLSFPGEDNTVRSDMREVRTGTRSRRPSARVEAPCTGTGRARKRLSKCPELSPVGEGL